MVSLISFLISSSVISMAIFVVMALVSLPLGDLAPSFGVLGYLSMVLTAFVMVVGRLAMDD